MVWKEREEVRLRLIARLIPPVATATGHVMSYAERHLVMHAYLIDACARATEYDSAPAHLWMLSIDLMHKLPSIDVMVPDYTWLRVRHLASTDLESPSLT
jgi:hypothetical protein